MQAKKLSAEELRIALNYTGSPVYEERKRARTALSDHIAALERELEEAKRSAWAMSQDVTTLGQQVEALALGEKP